MAEERDHTKRCPGGGKPAQRPLLARCPDCGLVLNAKVRTSDPITYEVPEHSALIGSGLGAS